MLIFQFIPLRNPKTTGRLLVSFQDARKVAVLDLEDSFWVPGNPEKGQEFKKRAREKIRLFCSEAGDRYKGIRLGVRVNPVGSDCFRLDLDVLKMLKDSLSLEFLILPKVEERRELKTCRAALAAAGFPELEIIPILESRAAFDRMDQILNACRSAGVERVLYGHYDYSLDAGHWPISGPAGFEYWEIIGWFLRKTEAAGLSYVHPPVADLNDVSGLRNCLGRLRGLALREFAIFSAGPSQTTILEQLSGEARERWESSPPLARGLPSGPEKRLLAGQVKEQFESNKRPEFSFAADARTGRFIAPHVYIAALNYLEAGETDHV